MAPEQEGLIAFYPGKPIDPRDREFWMISIWKDVESIKKAAGHEWQQPILLEDEADLVETVEIITSKSLETNTPIERQEILLTLLKKLCPAWGRLRYYPLTLR
ncbi:hypothetical protein [Ensifer sp. ENS12]|uniref:hypothetical protein n=1 Tax=Ensifer sp. ENS12 TaxID=2854774 RepID=UPI001C450919|nr:hypothetical protein [Ensifer sp. ENS12]MBV7522428.1 hypothetical protein [Ensifer sp. ENS12]